MYELSGFLKITSTDIPYQVEPVARLRCALIAKPRSATLFVIESKAVFAPTGRTGTVFHWIARDVNAKTRKDLWPSSTGCILDILASIDRVFHALFKVSSAQAWMVFFEAGRAQPYQCPFRISERFSCLGQIFWQDGRPTNTYDSPKPLMSQSASPDHFVYAGSADRQEGCCFIDTQKLKEAHWPESSV